MAAQPLRWLWKDQLALRKIAVVAGAANVGKSLLVTGDFAARVSVMRVTMKPATMGNDADNEKK